MKFIWDVVSVCSVIGFFQGVFMVMGAGSAVQQAVGATTIPSVVYASIEPMSKKWRS